MARGVQGLDKDVAPPAATAKRMLDAIGGRWWNVYIGGPESGGAGWTPRLLAEYAAHGIDRFMLTYVGRQAGGPLTRQQGRADAHDAIQIAKGFGYADDFPLCLDVEQHTFESAPAKTIEYVRAWCTTVHGLGVRPGVYANPGPLRAMHGVVPADFVWVASWVSHGAAARDPRGAPQMPAGMWPSPSQRAWQYAGAFGNKPCRVLGIDVDISVADLGLLAQAPRVQAGKRLARKRRAPVAAAPTTVAAPSGAAAAATATATTAVAARLNGNGSNGAPPRLTFADLSDDDLLRYIDRLDRALERARLAMVARYVAVNGNGAKAATKPVAATDLVRNLQRLLNRFTARNLHGLAPLAVDGKKGPATEQRIRAVRYYLGYTGSGLTSEVDDALVRRLTRPRSPRHSSPPMLARAARRRRAQRENARRSLAPRAGVATFDGRPVAAWIKPYLVWARRHGWEGTLTSGWRDPLYSEHLCKLKCGAPTCAGTCAGRTSNHSGRIRPAGAVDVTHPDVFAKLMLQCPLRPRLRNDLPHDRVHFSVTGH